MNIKETIKKDILINFVDDADKYIIFADLCGIDKNNIVVKIQGRTLMIKTNRDLKINSGYHTDEIKTGSLARMIEFNEDIDMTKITTDYNNGLLEITIPKIQYIDSYEIKIN